MKNFAVSLFVLTLLFSFTGNVFAKFAIGTIDVQKVLLSVNDSKGVNKKLKKELDKRQKKIKIEENKIRKAEESFKKQSVVLSDQAKFKKGREIHELKLKYQELAYKYQKEMQDLELKMKGPIVKKIEKVTQEVSKQMKVDMTLNKNVMPTVYIANEVDITAKVIAKYNKKHKK